jgi:hypothetical protein
MNFDLGDEHKLVEHSTREWGAREMAPRIQQLDHEHTFDRGPAAEDGRSRITWCLCAGEVWRRRDGLHQPRDRVRRAGVRRHLAASDPLRPRWAEQLDVIVVGDRSPEAEISGAAGSGQADRIVWPH